MEPRDYRYSGDVLRDRIVLVTGATSGIGKALALEAARVGARVLLHGRNVKKLEAVHDEIVALGRERPSIAVLDLAKAGSEAYVSLADSIRNELGRLDGLVHNAGILGPRLSIEQYDPAEWQRVLHVNLTAPFALTQVLLPLLRQSRDPSIVFTSSGVGRRARGYWGAYAVSKFGIEGLSQVVADEYRHVPIRANCINPGPTRTRMRAEAYPAEDPRKLRAPEEIVAAWIYLLGPDSRGVTGQSFDA
jgi:NAD(P)-dependent dehydrogenase (short-subunit alcohol dehydrogenase family)